MYQIINQNQNNNELEILLYSLITRGLTANRIIDQISHSNAEHITLRINSDGGEAFESIALYNFLKDKDVHVIVDGIAASGASIVAMADKTITMMQGSMMMIHQPLTLVAGYADDLRKEADILDKLTDSIASIYSSRSGKPKDEIIDIMKAESWLSDEECCINGFADEIDAPASEEDIKEEEQHPEPHPVEESALYREGVRAERQRLQELDELYTPERADIINAAKYETGEYASDIAIKLLKVSHSRPRPDTSPAVNSLPLRTNDDEARSIAEIINQWRN